jgi:hypothetical protein
MAKKPCRSKRPFLQKEKKAERKRAWGGGPSVSVVSAQEDGVDSSAQLEAIARGKAVFAEYYRLQRICENTEDLEKLCESMRHPLPIAFRICSAASRRDETDAAMKDIQSILENFEPRRVAGVHVVPPTYFEWCNAWQLGCDDRVLKAELRAGDPSSDLSQIAKWLNSANAAGVISRQEVSATGAYQTSKALADTFQYQLGIQRSLRNSSLA